MSKIDSNLICFKKKEKKRKEKKRKRKDLDNQIHQDIDVDHKYFHKMILEVKMIHDNSNNDLHFLNMFYMMGHMLFFFKKNKEKKKKNKLNMKFC